MSLTRFSRALASSQALKDHGLVKERPRTVATAATEARASSAEDKEPANGLERLSAKYGSGDGYYTDGASATGFYARPHERIGYAILHNDTETLKQLYSGKFVIDENAEDDEDKYFNFDFGYELEFVKDWERVVGRTRNEDALRLMLSLVDDFFLCSVDFWNAFAAGYDKGLLTSLLANWCSSVGNVAEFEENYGDGYLDDGVTPFCTLAELKKFLGMSSATASAQGTKATASADTVDVMGHPVELYEFDDPTAEEYKQYGNDFLRSIGRDDLVFYARGSDSIEKALSFRRTYDLLDMAEYFVERAREDDEFDPNEDYFYMKNGITMVTFGRKDFSFKGPFYDNDLLDSFKKWLIGNGVIQLSHNDMVDLGIVNED